MASPLPNRLRTVRTRSSLSQDETAFLLGAQGGDKVSRYERGGRTPHLEALLAYEAVFRKPPSELFPGLYRKVEREVAARAKAMSYRTEFRQQDRNTAKRLAVITSIAERRINEHSDGTKQ